MLYDPHRDKEYKIFLESRCPLIIRYRKYLDVTIVDSLFKQDSIKVNNIDT